MAGPCKFKARNGLTCHETGLDSGFCFWHDADVDKSKTELAGKLQDYVAKGGLTQGLKLKRANLQGVNLVHHNSQHGYDFSDSDFYRANLQGAHLFNLKLQHGSLMKANLHDANLHCASLDHTNLLGIKLHNAKLDNLKVGNQLLQENNAHNYLKNGKAELANDQFEQAEEIYRHLRRCAEHQGLHALNRDFSYKELTMHRYILPRFSLRRGFSYLVDLLCGYGEKPENTVLFSLMLIIVCAFGYFIFGVNQGSQLLQLNSQQGFMANTQTFVLTLYYSVVTFTTLGYGDITPFGITRLFAAFEAFIGNFSIALFVVVFVKRMSR